MCRMITVQKLRLPAWLEIFDGENVSCEFHMSANVFSAKFLRVERERDMGQFPRKLHHGYIIKTSNEPSFTRAENTRLALPCAQLRLRMYRNTARHRV